MDFLKKAASAASELSSKSSESAPQQQDQQQQQQQQTSSEGASNSAQTQDYGDKAFDFVSKKAGYNLSPETEEQVTDTARGLYEKFSGNKVDPKYSN